MRLDHYFRDELAYLRLQGKQFAEQHPELVRFLTEQSADPDVERLLEGFAFLTGSLRAKIEDEFPELTNSVLNLLWPNYLRPVPSVTIIQFSPVKGSMDSPLCVGKGYKINSVLRDNKMCCFRTCRDLWLYPADITHISTHSNTEFSTISVDFSLHREIPVTQLQLDKLYFYFSGDKWTACELYYWFSARLVSIELEAEDLSYRYPASVLKTAGFERADALLPYPDNVYSGYRILQEFFCFPENFLFFSLATGGDLQNITPVSSFKLHFHFDRVLPAELKVRDNALIINCTPAINLFSHDSEPVKLDGFQTEYPLKPSYQHAQNMEIFSVDTVQGWVTGADGRNRGSDRIYHPFESFQHQIELAKGRKSLYYRIRVSESMAGEGFEHQISFIRSDEAEMTGLDESISATLTCTNREQAAKLAVGDICNPASDKMSSYATCRNIIRPTRTLRPVLDASLHWTLISNLSLNYVSLLQRDALVQILRAYDFPALYDRQAEQASRKRMAGIDAIDTVSVHRLVRDMPVRGLKSTLSVRQSAFGSEGELYLFGTVLAHFFSLYASVNAFHLLEVVNLDTQERYTWPAKTGQHSLM